MKKSSFLNFLTFLVTFLSQLSLITPYKLRKARKNIIKYKPSLNYPKFLQIQNPDQPSGGATGGQSGEFVRRDQITEHILIPLLNNFEVEFPFAKDIREYRKQYVNEANKEIQRMDEKDEIPSIPKIPTCPKKTKK